MNNNVCLLYTSSCDSLKLCRIWAAYYVENADVQLNAEDILKCYDTFEWLVERLVDVYKRQVLWMRPLIL